MVSHIQCADKLYHSFPNYRKYTVQTTHFCLDNCIIIFELFESSMINSDDALKLW